jgi:hypothetical protein
MGTQTVVKEEQRPRTRYRRPKAQDEIYTLPALDHPGYLSAVLMAEQPETVVHAIRRLIASGRMVQSQQLIDRLVSVASERLATYAWKYFAGRDDQSYLDRQDVIQSAAIAFWAKVVNPAPEHDFTQCNALKVLNDLASNAARTIKRQRGEWERPAAQFPISLDKIKEDEDGLPPYTHRLATPGLERDAIDAIEVDEALDRLPHNVTWALLLDDAGFQIESKDPDQETISSIIGVTPRAIRNYLRDPRRYLKND